MGPHSKKGLAECAKRSLPVYLRPERNDDAQLLRRETALNLHMCWTKPNTPLILQGNSESPHMQNRAGQSLTSQLLHACLDEFHKKNSCTASFSSSLKSHSSQALAPHDHLPKCRALRDSARATLLARSFLKMNSWTHATANDRCFPQLQMYKNTSS